MTKLLAFDLSWPRLAGPVGGARQKFHLSHCPVLPGHPSQAPQTKFRTPLICQQIAPLRYILLLFAQNRIAVQADMDPSAEHDNNLYILQVIAGRK